MRRKGVFFKYFENLPEAQFVPMARLELRILNRQAIKFIVNEKKFYDNFKRKILYAKDDSNYAGGVIAALSLAVAAKVTGIRAPMPFVSFFHEPNI